MIIGIAVLVVILDQVVKYIVQHSMELADHSADSPCISSDV